jgi:hypothetical protein
VLVAVGDIVWITLAPGQGASKSVP